MISAITAIDFSILFWIQEHVRTAWLDSFFPFISYLGNSGMIWIIISVILLFFQRTRLCGICMLVCLAVDCILGEGILKHIIMRQRPCVTVPLHDMLIRIPATSSFPSGHTASSFTAATAVFLHHRSAGIAAYILAALIAFSRLYCYVHFPTDVAAGILLGVCVACVLTPCIQKFRRSR